MRAAWYEKNGPAAEVLHLGEIETPKPGPGDVRVKLKTSGVNPSDVKGRAGTTRKIAFRASFRTATAQARSIWSVRASHHRAPASGSGRGMDSGSAVRHATEYIVLPAHQAVRLPDATSFEAGACFGIPALTAWHAIDIAGIGSGSTVLVAGGAGAVANYAIQFAKARGATVITRCRRPPSEARARRGGRSHHRLQDRERRRARDGARERRRDAVIELDLTANASLLPAVLRPRGTLVVYGTGPQAAIPASFCLANAVTFKFVFVYELTPDERARAIADITRCWARARSGTISRRPFRSPTSSRRTRQSKAARSRGMW